MKYFKLLVVASFLTGCTAAPQASTTNVTNASSATVAQYQPCGSEVSNNCNGLCATIDGGGALCYPGGETQACEEAGCRFDDSCLVRESYPVQISCN